jgi:putative hydrolase of the HAD superfamily
VSRAALRGEPVSAVLFDYGLTLVTYTRPDAALHRAYTRIAALLPPHSGGRPWNPDELLDVVHDRIDARVAEHEASGTLEELDIYAAHRAAYSEIGADLSPDALDTAMRLEQEAWWQGMRVAADTVPVLSALRRAGLRLGICSNAPYRPASMRDQLAHVGLLPLVDAAVFSGEVGWRKPSPVIFTAALTALDAAAETTVMIGDRLREDIDGAHAAGLRAIRLREHHDDPDPDERADAVIDRLGDLPALLGLGAEEDRQAKV